MHSERMAPMTTPEANASTSKGLTPHWVAFWTASLYAFGVLVLGGGAGVWLPAVMPGKEVGIDALTTFVMATLTPIFTDLLLDAEIYGKKLSKFWRVLLVVGCLLAGALAMTALVREHATGPWTLGVFASVLSIVVWMAVAMKSERFLPVGPDTGSFGGSNPSASKLPGGGL